ncbi:MAG: DinB family protein [Holophaga sp.]|nr:DinB family protein [Holophaga sp.]
MISQLDSIAKVYAVGDSTLDGLVGDFKAADWRAADPVGHNAVWIVGHLALLRNRVAALVGPAPAAQPWEAAFGRGTSPAQVPADLDPLALVRTFHAAQKAMAGRWEALTAEDLAKPFGRTLPDGSDTVGGALGYLAWHEAYHLGQLGFLRRLAGKSGRA